MPQLSSVSPRELSRAVEGSVQDDVRDILQHSRNRTEFVLRSTRDGVPVIYFVKGGGGMLEIVKEVGADVLGLDWHVNLGKPRDILGDDVAVQGNLDPTVLYAPKDYIEKEVQRILNENADRPGFIFNLGHGILPTVPPENAIHMVECVHRLSQK